ncbi:MAG: phosphatidate cytidylyltransferase [Nitrospinae bacterium]|nr:phosphatidate cytidylyltransferase [Nitrospinota bacterium]
MKRIISAIVFLPAFFLIVQYGNATVFFVFLSAILLAALFEFYTLLIQNGQKCMIYAGMILGWFIALAFFINHNQLNPLSIVILLMGLFFIKLFSKQPVNFVVEEISNTLFGVLYVAFLLSYIIFIRKEEAGRQLIFMLFLIIWLGDTLAYYIGTSAGKHLLAPSISPNKSIEGAIGGLLGSIGGALLAHYWFYPSISIANCTILGLVTGIAGQMGDLCESILKRNLNVKDSGFLVPGHGGLLDRLDSVLFSAPVFYYIHLYLIKL